MITGLMDLFPPHEREHVFDGRAFKLFSSVVMTG
jgi:hypothetical protein